MAAAAAPPAFDPANPEYNGQTVLHWNLEHRFSISRSICRALHAEQMDTYEQLGRLSKDDVEDLFESMRRPGGAAGNTAQTRTRTNPGIRVTFLASRVINMTVYAARHFTRIQRPVDPNIITAEYLEQMRELKLKEERLKDKEVPPAPPVMKDETKVQQTVMDIRLHLQKCIGGYGIPLTYVIRRNEAVDDSIVYNGVGTVQEMIDRAPLTGPIFDTDNAAVWEVLATVIPPSVPFYVWIRAFERAQNGRAAFNQIIARFMDSRAAKNIVASAKNTLRTKYFDNTKPQQFPFGRFVNIHKKAHMEIDLYDARPILESEKIDYLTSGITAQELSNTCSTISLNVNNEFSTFDSAVSALQAELNRQEGVKAHRKRTVSTVERSSGGRSGDGGRGGGRGGRGRGGRGRGRGGRGGRGRGRGRGSQGGRIPDQEWNEIMQRKQKRQKETEDEIAAARKRHMSSTSTEQKSDDEAKGRSPSSMTRRH